MLPMILVLVLAQLSPTVAIPAPPTQRVQRLLLDLYPELRSGDIAIETFGDDVTIRVLVKRRSAKRTPGSEAVETLLLEGEIERSPTTRNVEALRARGAIVSTAELNALNKLVQTHPEWTNADIGQAIAASGGRFPPAQKQALLQQAQTSTEQLSANASIEDVQFVTAGAQGAPVWLVDMRTPTRTYRMALEPFHGRVIQMVAK